MNEHFFSYPTVMELPATVDSWSPGARDSDKDRFGRPPAPDVSGRPSDRQTDLTQTAW